MLLLLVQMLVLASDLYLTAQTGLGRDPYAAEEAEDGRDCEEEEGREEEREEGREEVAGGVMLLSDRAEG